MGKVIHGGVTQGVPGVTCSRSVLCWPRLIGQNLQVRGDTAGQGLKVIAPLQRRYYPTLCIDFRVFDNAVGNPFKVGLIEL